MYLVHIFVDMTETLAVGKVTTKPEDRKLYTCKYQNLIVTYTSQIYFLIHSLNTDSDTSSYKSIT